MYAVDRGSERPEKGRCTIKRLGEPSACGMSLPGSEKDSLIDSLIDRAYCLKGSTASSTCPWSPSFQILPNFLFHSHGLRMSLKVPVIEKPLHETQSRRKQPS
jgi:hypothetical protein